VARALTLEYFKPEMVAGHSLGEFSALVANQALTFEDGLKLVAKRADAMQKACEENPSTMAAILGLEDQVVADICASIMDEIVVPANYNCPGQIVVSGSNVGVDIACEKLTKAGARRALKLPVGGAFHSPLMEPAKLELEKAIHDTTVSKPICPIYQNVTAQIVSNPDIIKSNLIAQLTAPVKWTQTVNAMLRDGATSFTEIGPGRVLSGLIKKVNRQVETSSEG
jgi:[acyl-carrier-protein] S-malonyltransferase